MLNKDDIRKLAKKVVHHQQGRRTHQIMHPERDWLIGVGLAVFIVVTSAVWSGSKYVETRETISAGVTAEAEDAAVYRESNVKAALELASGRKFLEDVVEPAESFDTTPATSTTTTTESVTEEDLEEATPLEATFSESEPPEPTPEPSDVPVSFE